MADPGANLAAVQKGIDLFNAGDLETLFEEVFHPEVEYTGDPDVSGLAGFPTDHKGVEAVRVVWEAFFAMFDQPQLSEIVLEPANDDRVLGRCHMALHGGSSEVPIDATFHFAWVLREGRWRFMAAKLDRGAMLAALEAWRED